MRRLLLALVLLISMQGHTLAGVLDSTSDEELQEGSSIKYEATKLGKEAIQLDWKRIGDIKEKINKQRWGSGGDEISRDDLTNAKRYSQMLCLFFLGGFVQF